MKLLASDLNGQNYIIMSSTSQKPNIQEKDFKIQANL